MTLPPTLGFIGAGRVGQTLSRLWYERGYTIAAVFSRSFSSAEACADAVSAAAVTDPLEVVRHSDLIFLTVPDDNIAETAARLAVVSLEGKAIVHTSGAKAASILDPLVRRGAATGSLHPVFPFAEVETAIARAPGSVFALEAEGYLRDWLEALIESVSGQIMLIPPGGKARYHAALNFVGAFTVTMYNVAASIFRTLDMDTPVAHAALYSLMLAAVQNVQAVGLPDALTGPISRGDATTIADHLVALNAPEIDGDILEAYSLLARLTLPIAAEQGTDISELESLLKGHLHNA